jgi:EmrB/QacA subfamily drug resistance transporter
MIIVQYKWVALSNTTLGILMASINSNIILIAMPAIFRGIGLNPLSPDAFQYLLWLLFGYNIVTSTLLVTFGRISDMFGRVKLYNLGFAIFTAGSIMLYLTPSTGALGAQELILFRIVQGIGGAFLFANSAAIITDAFSHKERGKALGINMVAALVGSLLGIILGGVLASFDWRAVFLVSVPFGVAGTAWSYLKLKELGITEKRPKIDLAGNVAFAAGLTLLLVGVTYGLLPYGSNLTGWSNPLIIGTMIAGALLIVAFVLIERRVESPMFKLELFKIKMFSAANFAGILGAIARGGAMLMLIIFLQAIWLPLHGISYESTPFWSGVYMLPMLLGFVVMGPLSGWLSDRYGARGLASLGMLITAVGMLLITTLPYNFVYWEFAIFLLIIGIGGGMFAAPNTTSIMNSVPPDSRGAASGMRATLQNVGSTMSLALFFTIVIFSLASSLPTQLSSALTNAGAPQLASKISSIPPTSALFAAFLGINPMKALIANLPANSTAELSSNTLNVLESNTWFPNAIAKSFLTALTAAFYIGASLSVIGAIASLLRGKKYINEEAIRYDERRISKLESKLDKKRRKPYRLKG